MVTVGLVVWTNDVTRNAIVWCDDQGPLVRIDDVDAHLEDGQRLRIGDLIQIACRDEPGEPRACLWLRVLMPAFLPEARRLFWPGAVRGGVADVGVTAACANLDGPPSSLRSERGQTP
jgi:hypothetical protein